MGFSCGLEGCSHHGIDGGGHCSKFKAIHYCCKEHQAKDWKRHRKDCTKKVLPKSAGTPSFHEEYKDSYPTDHDGFSTLSMAFMNIQMKTSPLQNMMSAFEESILDGFGTVGKILSKRWDFDVSCEPGILEFLRKRDTSKGKVWRAHPRLARSIPFGSAFLSDGTQIQAIKMQNMRNTPSPEAPLERGRTYVSLGFVDLQQLMEAEVKGPAENGRSIAWHGYDMNPVAVAKAKLIVAMLKEEVPLVQILQIWFSTAISSETAKTLAMFSKKLRLSEKHGEL